jgi:hypothetical protein
MQEASYAKAEAITAKWLEVDVHLSKCYGGGNVGKCR